MFRLPWRHGGLTCLLLLVLLTNAAMTQSSPLFNEFFSRAVFQLLDPPPTGGSPLRLSPTLQLNVSSIACSKFDIKDFSITSTEFEHRLFPTAQLGLARMECKLVAEEMGKGTGVEITLVIRNAFATLGLELEKAHVSLQQCVTAHELDALQLTGLEAHPLSKAAMELAFNAISPLIASRIMNPLFCQAAQTLVLGANLARQVFSLFISTEQATRKSDAFWPSIKRLEAHVHAHSENSSLLAAPYSESTMFRVVDHVINDLVGAPSKLDPKQMVINKVILDRLGKEFAFDFETLGFEFTLLQVPFQISISRLAFANWDTFTRIKLMHPTSKFTLSHLLEMTPAELAGLDFKFLVNGRVDFSLNGLGISGLKLDVKTLFALDKELFLDANLGHIATCILASFMALQVPKLDFDFTQFTFPRLSSSADPRLAKWIQASADYLIWPLLPSKRELQLAARAFSWNISPLLSRFIQWMQYCPAPKSVPGNCTSDAYIKWPQLSFVGKAMSAVLGNPADEVDFSISRVVEIAVRELSSSSSSTGATELGYLVRNETFHAGPGSMLGLFPTLPANASAEIWFGNLSLGPLNDFQALHVLLPPATLRDGKEEMDVYAMENVIEMNAHRKLAIEFDLKWSLSGLLMEDDDARMEPWFHVRFAFDNINISAISLLELALPSCLELRQVFALDSCVANLFGPRINPFEHVSMQFEHTSLALSCHGSDEDDGEGKCKMAFTQAFADHLTQSGPALQDFILRRMMPKALQVMSGRDIGYFDGFNITLGMERFIAEQAVLCAGGEINRRKHDLPQAPSWIPSMRYVMFIAAVLSLVLFALYVRYMKQKHLEMQTEQHERLLASPLLQSVLGEEEEEEELETAASRTTAAVSVAFAASSTNSAALRHIDALMATTSPTRREDALYLIGHNKPLFDHPGLGHPIRWGVLLALLINFIFFVSGNFFTMGEITIKLFVGEESIREIPMMTLTLQTCIDMMITARALLFALFIGGCSGIFPWIRVALLAFAWLAEPTILPPATRGKLLETLELLGKFALAEVYLFTILMTVVNVDMRLPGSDETLAAFLLPGTLVADVECVPRWGLFTFLVGTWLSLALNHLLVHLHRLATKKDSRVLGIPRSAKDMGILDISPLTQFLVLFVWPLTLMGALALDILKVEFLGFSGFGINLLQQGKADLSVSLFTIFPRMVSSDHADLINPFGKFLLMLGYGLFILVAPALHCLLGMGICAFNGRFASAVRRHHVLNAMRMLHVWSTLEVLALTLLVISLQLHKFFLAMSGEITFLPDWIPIVLDEFGASEEQAVGFGVKPELQPTGFALVCLVVLCAHVANARLKQALLSYDGAK